MEANSKPQRVRQMTKNDLILLGCEHRKDKLLETLACTSFGFEKFLLKREYCKANDELDFEILAVLVQIISDACTVSLERKRGILKKFLEMIKGCKQFIYNDILLAVNTLLIKKHPTNLVLLTSQYLIILRTLISFFECREIIDDVFPAMQNYINTIKSKKIRNIDDIQIQFDKLKRLIDRYDNSLVSRILDDLDDTGDFKKLSIVPKENDVINCEIQDLPHNIIDAPYTSVYHYLGVHFRLTREDMLRSFRECVKNCLNCDENAIMRSSNRVYNNVLMIPPVKYMIRGIQYNVAVTLNREVDWSKKEILLPGSIVCLTPNNFRKVVFASVQEIKAKSGKSQECNLKLILEDDLYKDELLPKTQYLMVEPSAYFECYKHVLASIKSFSPETFPLSDFLVYLESNDPSPEYLRDPDILLGKKYCLHEKCDGDRSISPHPCKEFDPLNEDEWPSATDLGFDEQQHAAFQLALTKKVAVIQGPPGTGKTYIGKKVVKALLENTALTPIIICCLTNHALDQFLEGILEHTDNVVRLGSQSKSTILESHTIENIMFTLKYYNDNKKTVKNFDEDHYLKTNATAKKSLSFLRKNMPNLLETSSSGDFDQNTVELKEVCYELNHYIEMLCSCESNYLEETALHEIIGMEEKKQLEAGAATHSNKLTSHILEWLLCSKKSDLYEKCRQRFADLKNHKVSLSNKKCTKLWSLNLSHRFEQFYIWREECLSLLKRHVDESFSYYQKLKMAGVGSRTSSNKIDVLSKTTVIGVTTTGAAKYRDLIQLTDPSIMIVEEAAEVLESHIIASLLPTMKHLILIGDHKQLRPLPSCHELSELYNLKISMFERLFTNNIPSSTLVFQHRMKPCIADLLVNEYLYEDLKSYENVYEYKEINGVKSSVFFFNHKESESENSSSTSSSNVYEAKMVVALTKYLLLQSYSFDQITILATYAAQVNLIQKNLIEENLEVKCTTVDNYQGEENDIVIVSFVRNNKSGVIGFLKENNRVCVALSRAKKGMFCFGNFSLYAEKSPLWRNIVDKLEEQEMIGDKFSLQCSKHGSKTFVTTPSEIVEFSNRGCQEPCNFQLACGHICPKKCHYKDADHVNYQCKKPCEKFIDEDKKCPRLCWQPCKRVKKNIIQLSCGHKSRPTLNDGGLICLEEVQKFLPCQHIVTVSCSTDVEVYLCKASETVNLACGHTKRVPCYRKNQSKFIICHEKRPLLSPCGHTVDVECNLTLEDSELLAYCDNLCGVLLDCGHPCMGLCRFCFDFGIHSFCTSRCELTLNCGHPCQGCCKSPCLPCKETCGMICPHEHSEYSKCINSCYRPCIECREPCMLHCEHVECPNFCYQECSVEPCSKVCEEKLECGHPCIGLCGDPCPYLCRVCNESDLTSGNPKSDRYVMLHDCDHVVEVKQLTEHIEDCLLSFEWPHCPLCKKSIFQSLRFKNQLLYAKRRLFESSDTSKMVNEIQFLIHTAYNDDYIVPAVFRDVHEEIVSILECQSPSFAVLEVLKISVMCIRRLVKVHEKLENSCDVFKRELQNRFETLLLWISNHLKYASYQQLTEIEKAIDELVKSSKILVN